MTRITPFLWLIPVLPLIAAAVTALTPRRFRKFAAGMNIGSMGVAAALSLVALTVTIRAAAAGGLARQELNFSWLQIGDSWLKLGWVLDPLTAVMLVMVTIVGLLIFIYSVGYMAHDDNFTRFFCFLSLFAAAMLGLVIANSLLLLFICWELVGLTSYLLIGFWYHKPAAAAAAKKAFITTRIGDLALLLGMVWLYSQTGTLLFYEGGSGCLEQSALIGLATRTTVLGLAVATAIGLLIFCGAVGKSGQVPLHVWLPDAMEGPTPVSALIHAATMVAAGVFLVARTYPLMNAPALAGGVSLALEVVTWTGAVTAVFAAGIAVAQTDIKRILAYSTVSQLGFMMMGLGVGGVAVGMFHLITHACFKALLFMGAGSVIHGCHEEQDIRRMGGLRKLMPVTFATYAIGMMALSGVPLFFSGFWSKDGILHAAHAWPYSHGPFYLGIVGACLTAFYMTRQLVLVFFGSSRLSSEPHESPGTMTFPLVALAAATLLLGFAGTPAWPWFQGFLEAEHIQFAPARLWARGTAVMMLLSALIAAFGIGAGWWLYGRREYTVAGRDELEQRFPLTFELLRRKFFVDEIYEWSVVRFTRGCANACDWVDRWLIDGAVQLLSLVAVGFSWLSRLFDEYFINAGFDQGCGGLSRSGGRFSRLQNGQVQRYLRVIGIGTAVLVLILIWGRRAA